MGSSISKNGFRVERIGKEFELMRRLDIFILCLLMIFGRASAQPERRSTAAVRLRTAPRIDGVLDEALWQNLPALSDFIQFEPYNGQAASQATVARIGYDDQAIYLGAICYDSAPDSILTELGKRDSQDGVNADIFALHINPYNEGFHSVLFMVSAAGVQSDKCYTTEGSDISWDAVWESRVRITDEGWTVEMRIPYSALRFPDSPQQDWGINIFRMLKRRDEWSAWSPVSNEVSRWWYQIGELRGLQDINPPLRLSLVPYVSANLENDTANEWGRNYHGGMDLKYGINESFTLDMTLIPDFGQVQSDDEVLNLTPFEVRYDEKRQFFTEGTELFQRGGLFYSRRIGGRPRLYDAVGDSLTGAEKIDKRPTETQLLNATKVSGRLRNGLGIGFFNAMTARSLATLRDSLTGAEREIVLQPFTNYNIVVLDQVLPHNSYISVINTNLHHEAYTGNVTGSEFRFADRENRFAVQGGAALTQKWFPDSSRSGYAYRVDLGKISGRWQYSYELGLESDSYDPNDMGFMRQNNELEQHLELAHNVFEPFGIFWRIFNELELSLQHRYKPRKQGELHLDYSVEAVLRNNQYARLHIGWRPIAGYDFYEPRVAGRYLELAPYIHACGGYRSNEKRSFSIGVFGGYTRHYDYFTEKRSWWTEISPMLRFSDRLRIRYVLFPRWRRNDIGYVDHEDEQTVHFGRRDTYTLEQTFTLDYIFTNRSALDLRLRHYWSKAAHADFYRLQDDGSLILEPDYQNDYDVNYNAFTVDMVFTWNFAPGSELLLVWKNAIFEDGERLYERYWDNLESTLHSAQINSVSIKVLYYLDYLKLRRLW